MKDLLEYYRQCFALVDGFHFNSSGTREEFERLCGPLPGEVIPITHGRIGDNRKRREYSSGTLRIGFVGNPMPYKGVQVLESAASNLDALISAWGSNAADTPKTSWNGFFGEDSREEVYASMDLLVVPSICHETFGFAALEALSYGVPVVVSDKVGARDVVRRYAPWAVYSTPEELENLLSRICACRSMLDDYNERICSGEWNYDIMDHAAAIVEKMYENC